MEKTRIRIFFALAIFAVAGCVTTQKSDTNDRINRSSSFSNTFHLPGEVPAAAPVYSIKLHPSGQPGSAPFLELSSSAQLELTFETIGTDSRSYRYYFTHHHPDGTESNLSPDQFIEGFTQSNITGGNLSRTNRPAYRQFQVRFPTRELQFKVSGNYMIHVVDQDTGSTIFSIPFFVHENEGELRSSVETNSVPRQDMRIRHRPVNHYLLPDFVNQPQFDLSVYLVQHQFWGRAKRAGEVDYSDPLEVYATLSLDNQFVGDYEFRILDLREGLSNRNASYEIMESDDEFNRIILFDDAEGFSDSISGTLHSMPGASTSLLTNYLNVEFRFDADITPDQHSKIYLIGDFNRWIPDDRYQLEYNDEIGRWVVNAIMKEGTYRYKYVLVENGNLNDLYFDSLFQSGRQEYHTLVYLRDTKEFYTRLLQVNTYYR